jgi:hypothetical protein
LNRTLFRGVIAATLSGALLTGAGVVGTALASDYGSVPPGPAKTYVDDRGLAPHLPIRPVKRVTPRHHPVKPRATRTFQRPALVGGPRTIAHGMLLRRGWSETQWGCLDALWTRESGWQTYASNGSSGAYGIPQALPGWKMSSFGSDWRTNPVTQISWGLWYIGQTYGSPCNALSHSNSYGYY